MSNKIALPLFTADYTLYPSPSLNPPVSLDGHRVDALLAGELAADSLEKKVSESVSSSLNTIPDKPRFDPKFASIAKELSDDEELDRFSLADEDEDQPVPSRANTPSLNDWGSASASAFSSPSTFSLWGSSSVSSAYESPDSKEEPLPSSCAGAAYCLAFTAKVRDSYLADRLFEVPVQTLDELTERFIKIERKLRCTPQQSTFNRAIFNFIHQVVSKSQQKQALQRHTEKGIEILKLKPSIKVLDLIERMTPLFSKFNSEKKLPLLFPLSAEKKYLEKCTNSNFKKLLADFGQNAQFSLSNYNLLISLLNEVELAGQTDILKGFVSTISSFPEFYTQLMTRRDECLIIQKLGSEKEDSFGEELEIAYDQEKKVFVPELADRIVDSLTEEIVHDLNRIDAQKAARAEERRKKIAHVERIAEDILSTLFLPAT